MILLLQYTLIFASVLLLVALGGCFSEHSGIINIGLEGMMLVGSFAVICGQIAFPGSIAAGMLFAIAAGIALSLLFALAVLRFDANQIITGIGINLLGVGLTSFLLRAVYDTQGTLRSEVMGKLPTISLPFLKDVPILGGIFGEQNLLTYISFLMVLVTALLSPYAGSPAAVFVLAMVVCGTLEYLTSYLMEKLFHARWWDYSHYRFNIQGRICLLGAIVFGFGGVLIIDVVQPQVERLTAMIPLLAVHVICAVAAIVVIIDTIVTVVGIVGLSERLAKFSEAVQDRAEKAGDSWQWGKEEFREKMHDLSESSQERVANMRQLVSSALNWQQRRMIRSFPRMRSTDSTKYSKIMETVREMLRRK